MKWLLKQTVLSWYYTHSVERGKKKIKMKKSKIPLFLKQPGLDLLDFSALRFVVNFSSSHIYILTIIQIDNGNWDVRSFNSSTVMKLTRSSLIHESLNFDKLLFQLMFAVVISDVSRSRNYKYIA